MKHHLFFAVIFLFAAMTVLADGRQYVVATWNMKWLGGSVGALDDTNNAYRYVKEILESKATIFALQEITPSHSENGVAKCHYLDLILAGLKKTHHKWACFVDLKNESQRLGFIYDSSKWTLLDAKSISPGNAFGGRMRKPLLASFQANDNSCFRIDIINIHLKAFPDGVENRKHQFAQLAEWLKKNRTESYTIICGDTNIYKDETNPAIPLEDAGFTESPSDENTAIYNNVLSQRFDRFYLNRTVMEQLKASGSGNTIDSKQESANGKFKEYAETVSDHFPVTLTIIAN